MTRRLPWARRRPATPPESRPRLPSLDLLLQVAMQERDKQFGHFDALDTKAGVLLAFDGVLIVISHGIRFAFLVPGIVLTSVSAALALAAFWPRKFPTLEPEALRQFLTYETERSRLKLHDTIAKTVALGGQVLRTKARNLKLALVFLLLAVVTFGAGTIITTSSVNAGRTHHGAREQTRKTTRKPTRKPTPARASASPSASPS